MSKRTLDTFFAPPSKKAKTETVSLPNNPSSATSKSTEHPSYPWPVSQLPSHLEEEVSQLVTAQGKLINNQPHLDLLYFQPLIPAPASNDLFKFLRSSLFFYRVSYPIKRFGKETIINTPRFTTVFGVDATSIFQRGRLFSASSPDTPIPKSKYKCTPRPIPECLDLLRRVTEAATDTSYNFCLVNYYANGNDSISYHSDDEHFLEPNPTIASFSLGASRDFLLKHKPPPPPSSNPPDPNTTNSPSNPPTTSTLKLPLTSGDMILMRGTTQPNWLHSIPKRKGPDAAKGRINITLRKAMIPAGTENYYRYNVGSGGVYRWDEQKKEMVQWDKGKEA